MALRSYIPFGRALLPGREGTHESRTIGRVWVGKTESGIPVQALILRVAVSNDDQQEDFERELRAVRAPAPVPQAFPLRMML